MSEVVVGDVVRPGEAIVEASQRLAAGLLAMGVAAGDAVALLLRNDFAVFEANLGVRRIDAYGVPINWHWHAEEIGYVLKDCAPKLLIGHRELLERVRPLIPDGLPVVSVGGGEGFVDYAVWLATQRPYAGQGAGLGSSMIYTSGTTGRPKAVRRLPANPAETALRARVLAVIHDTAPGNVALVTGPMYHLFSQAIAMASFGARAKVVVMPSFDPEEMLRLVERHRVTHAALVPTLFTRLLRLPEAVRARYDLSSLRHVVHSGAPCPPEIKRAMIAWWGPVLYETYGSSETGVVTKIGSQEWLEHPGSVGRPVLTGEVRILGGDRRWAGAEVVGDVYLKMHGAPDFTFHGAPEKRVAVEHEGFITCGDIGWMDRDGRLYLCDRRVDMLISGGVNIYPAEIEAALLEHPDIEDAAVFGVPDAEFGEAVAAHVQASPQAGLTEQAVRDHVRARLAGYKVPRVVVVVDRLPREESGKLLKRKLKAPYWERAAAHA
jgi:long-chain acyl-CoA synthetase